MSVLGTVKFVSELERLLCFMISGREEEMWLHIDAAYAGSAFVCPEFRGWMEGIEYADSLAFNPSKWLMVHFDCTAMWVRNSRSLHRTFNVDPLYLQHENTGEGWNNLRPPR